MSNKEIEKRIIVNEATGMPLNRWEAYMKTKALAEGYHGRFSIGTIDGISMITVYKATKKLK